MGKTPSVYLGMYSTGVIPYHTYAPPTYCVRTTAGQQHRRKCWICHGGGGGKSGSRGPQMYDPGCHHMLYPGQGSQLSRCWPLALNGCAAQGTSYYVLLIVPHSKWAREKYCCPPNRHLAGVLRCLKRMEVHLVSGGS